KVRLFGVDSTRTTSSPGSGSRLPFGSMNTIQPPLQSVVPSQAPPPREGHSTAGWRYVTAATRASCSWLVSAEVAALARCCSSRPPSAGTATVVQMVRTAIATIASTSVKPCVLRLMDGPPWPGPDQHGCAVGPTASAGSHPWGRKIPQRPHFLWSLPAGCSACRSARFLIAAQAAPTLDPHDLLCSSPRQLPARRPLP